jgi:lysozyme
MTAEGFARLKWQLRRDEGSRLDAYRDLGGVLTIGVGHNIDAHGIRITVEQEEQLLREDMTRAITELVAVLPWVLDLDEPRQRVIYNMAFNLGTPKLLKFDRTLATIKRGCEAIQAGRVVEAQAEYTKAATQMLESLWAKQVGTRATRLAETMRSGED